MHKASTIHWIILVGFVVMSLLFAIMTGSYALSFQDIGFIFLEKMTFIIENSDLLTKDMDSHKVAINIIWEIRLPRVLMAMITGAGLAIAGVILQTITRNPLADPYLFGISSGASLGAVITLSLSSVLLLDTSLGALIGSFLAMTCVLVIASQKKDISIERLLLSGIAISFLFSAMTSGMLYFSNPDIVGNWFFWMMGSFSNASWYDLILPVWVVFISLCLLLFLHPWITALLAGYEQALTMGVPVQALRLGLFIVCSSVTAILVAKSGGIGFVGLMVPHMMRVWFGSKIRSLIIASALFGGAFMVWCDLIARSVLSYQVLPIGMITAMIGSLFFLIILYKR